MLLNLGALMSGKSKAAIQAKELLRSECNGVLATHSKKLAGFPFGSLVPFCLDGDGLPVILISEIAQHTANIKADNKVSLTITQSGIDYVQSGARLTWIGCAEQTDDEISAERYYRFFPESRNYHKTHNFSFYRIVPVKSRFISGFGGIYWLDNEQVAESNPFAGLLEGEMIDHMNSDHASTLEDYWLQTGEVDFGNQSPVMVGADARGINLRAGHRVNRLQFSERAESPGEVRRQLIAMAHEK